MATSYTSNKKIGALDSASTPLAATNEIVINQNGDILKTTLSAVEAKVFDAKTAITNPSGTEVVVVRQTDNALRQVALSNILPVGVVTNDNITTDPTKAIQDTKLATINTAGKVTNNAVQATATNTANRIVTRDGSGNFEAGTITATLSGNATTATSATTATTLATGRTIALTGDVTGTTGTFNGSANVSAAATLANSGVAAGTYNDNAAQVRPFTVDAKGRVTAVGTAVPITIDYSAVTRMPYKGAARLATTANLTATYANGTAGVGATLTNSGTLGALSIDGVAVASSDRILVKDQTTAAQNGIYSVTNTGSAVAAWVLTRVTDADTNTELGSAVVTVTSGTANGGRVYMTFFEATDTVGTTAMPWHRVVSTGDSQTVSTAMLADSNVTTAKIADGAVTSGKIADGTIINADVSESAAIAASKLEISAQQSLVPAGAVMPFAMNSAPAGWLAADGTAVSRSTYAALFAAIGTTHGSGNGSTTFNLPDLRGIFVRGSGSQTISGTTYNKTFAAKETDDFRSHSHSGSIRYTPGSNIVHTLTGGPSAITTGYAYDGGNSTGSTGGTETRPANIALLYCIKH